MTFIKEIKTILRKSDNSSVVLNIDDNLEYKILDNNLNTILNHRLHDGEFDYTNTFFDIDKNDIIYGLINDNKGKLININIDNDIITKSTLLKYDYKNFIIKFPYIKIFDNEKHIIYFSINKKNRCFSQLIHIYTNNNIHKKNKIDLINYNIMSNFTINWKNNIPTIFYFNRISGFEELFMSTFNLDTLNWSTPLKLTNTKKNKIYLDVISTADDYYHIVYSENHNGKYSCEYLKLKTNENHFKILESNKMKNHIMCLFPTIISNNSNIFIQWVEYHDLYTCKSYDCGKTWSDTIKNSSISNYPFLRYAYKSNYNLNTYNLSYIFGIDNIYDINKFFPK